MHLLEQLQRLAEHREVDIAEAGDVAARVRNARNEALSYRIVDDDEYGGDGARRLLEYCNRARPCGKDDIRRELHQFVCKAARALDIAARPASLETDILAFRPTQFLQSMAERSEAGLRAGIVFAWPSHEKADTRIRFACCGRARAAKKKPSRQSRI